MDFNLGGNKKEKVQDLSTDVQNYLNQGYSLNEVKHYLMQEGNLKKDVEYAIRKVMNGGKDPKLEVQQDFNDPQRNKSDYKPKKTIPYLDQIPEEYLHYAKIGVPIALGILAFFFVAMIFIGYTPAVNISFVTSIENDILYAGDQLIIDLEINNYGSDLSESISIDIEVQGTEMYTYEQIDLTSQTSKRFIIDIPKNLEEGQYTLTVTLDHNDFQKSKSLQIYINNVKSYYKEESNSEIFEPLQNNSDEKKSEVIVKEIPFAQENETNQTIMKKDTNSSLTNISESNNNTNSTIE